jgi:hypothetical protein
MLKRIALGVIVSAALAIPAHAQDCCPYDGR